MIRDDDDDDDDDDNKTQKSPRVTTSHKGQPIPNTKICQSNAYTV